MSWEVRQGDALERLREMPDESVHCCITSPPYWGLRDYGSDVQLGLEATPDLYVANLVAVFREVRRVLRPDGTLWLNLGDSYQSGKGAPGGELAWREGRNADEKNGARRFGARPNDKPIAGLKPKDLVGIPWLTAFALRANGWWLRAETIWAKPNPMPESITDRPTRAHEQVFLLTKSARYFYDAEAIREPVTEGSRERYGGEAEPLVDHAWIAGRVGGVEPHHGSLAVNGGGRDLSAGRNKRSVWNIATAPFPGAHFAVFPPKLVEPMVLAGCPQDGVVLDSFCGAGTTGLVALRHGRSFIGIELNESYAEMARQRIRDDQPLFNHQSEVAA